LARACDSPDFFISRRSRNQKMAFHNSAC
jgi:hypothetical protein